MLVHLLNCHRAIGVTNDKMRLALSTIVVPELRRRGFEGRLPHFRRFLPARLDVLGFQFNKYGGSFVVEVGACGPSGLRRDSEVIPPEKITYGDLPTEHRLRLGSSPDRGIFDHWFKFRRGFLVYWFDYEAPAAEVLKLLDQAESFWTSHDVAQNA
jgi:hypothetical protein